MFVKTLYERRFWKPFKGPIIPCGSMTEYHPISAKDHSRLHQCDKKVLLAIFVGYALIAVRVWKGDILEIHARRLSKDPLMQKQSEHCEFPIADGSVTLSGRD